VAHELEHHPLQFGLRHLAVSDPYFGIGGEFLDHGSALPDRIDAIVQEVDLSAASELQFHRLPDEFRVERRHHGVDREPVLGRSLDHGHVAHTQ
jgi:hypothetical protein